MRPLVEKLLGGDRLTQPEARALLAAMTDESLDVVLAATALSALRTRGESAEEVRAFALGLQELAIDPGIGSSADAVDIVGTGGDGSGSLNLSTGAALVAAAAGVPVIKHGNRAVSSASGSFDVLSALGLDVPWEPDKAKNVFDDTGFTYLFAPAFHPAMKAVAPVRRSMGARTIFNLVGPLANPARVGYLVVGAFSPQVASMMADTLAGMPIRRAFVISGAGGWDEPTPVGPYELYDVTPGLVSRRVEDPLVMGLARCKPTDLIGGDSTTNANAIKAVFEGDVGPHRDALVLGASLAMRARGMELRQSMRTARRAIDDGSCAALLEDLQAVTAREHAGV